MWKEIWRTSRWFIAKNNQDDEKIIRIKTITVNQIQLAVRFLNTFRS